MAPKSGAKQGTMSTHDRLDDQSGKNAILIPRKGGKKPTTGRKGSKGK